MAVIRTELYTRVSAHTNSVFTHSCKRPAPVVDTFSAGYFSAY